MLLYANNKKVFGSLALPL